MSSGSQAWELLEEADGSRVFRVAQWSHFFDFLEAEIFDSTKPQWSYVWRGQRKSDWSLSTTLDRLFSRLGYLTEKGPDALEKKAADLLDQFRLAARGRRGSNSPSQLGENEWWALGQHFGLATPLLDWTRSPFAAAYFAFEDPGTDCTSFRAVYGLSRKAIAVKNRELISGTSLESGRPPTIDFIEPLSDENQRLVSQGGLLTRAPIGTTIEQWVANAFEGLQIPVLLKIEVPNDDRVSCLLGLDRMNINHASLFPDLSGATRWTNLMFELNRED